MRIRGVDLAKVDETRYSFLRIRQHGLRTCVMLRMPVRDWKVKYLPDNLSESYEHGRKLGAAFGDVVDAWEIDNEPDLGFVPESSERYTAFLKATYLGLNAGIAEAQRTNVAQNNATLPTADRPPFTESRAPSTVNRQPSTAPRSPAVNRHPSTVPSEPLVLMGSLGLPPGPWLERFAANDGFAYTDGFNYHYYGYAEDFTGVYRQHEAAATELTANSIGQDRRNLVFESGINSGLRFQVSGFRQKNLPIFLTELGYGHLGPITAGAKEGRLRQWRWFRIVGDQVDALHIEGPMAFYLPPYLENGAIEYGLTAKPVSESGDAQSKPSNSSTWTAGGITYHPNDFAEDQDSGHQSTTSSSLAWASHIGLKIAGNELTPAGAWWLAAPRATQTSTPSDRSKRIPIKPLYPQSPLLTPSHPHPLTPSSLALTPSNSSRSWPIVTPAPSPIVIDFLPDAGLSSIKRYNGIFVIGTTKPGGRWTVDSKTVRSSTADRSPAPAPSRSEELTFHIRAANGNLFEVYPTRLAKTDWQHFFEPGDNFTMSFYGRAELPWRFKDNKPASLVIVMYPSQLPATFEFRRLQLLRLVSPPEAQNAKISPQVSGFRSQVSPAYRYGRGTIVLYNFSDQPVTGRLILPDFITLLPRSSEAPSSHPHTLTPSHPSDSRSHPRTLAPSHPQTITLSPGERRTIEVSITVPAVGYERFPAEIQFIPEAPSSQVSFETAARFRTDFIPDIGGLNTELIASLLSPEFSQNRDLIANRHRATEEAPMTEQSFAPQDSTDNRPPPTVHRPPSTGDSSPSTGNRPPATAGSPPSTVDRQPSTGLSFTAFAQSGVQITPTSDGFTATIASLPPGKDQRVEMEIPWPDGLDFPRDGFFSVEYRLH